MPPPPRISKCPNKSVLERVSYTIGFMADNFAGFETVGVCPGIHAVRK